jgi:H+/Cl- antiporter ClcA
MGNAQALECKIKKHKTSRFPSFSFATCQMTARSSSETFSVEQPSFNASLASTLNRLQPSPETVVLLLSILIGGGTGLAVVLFHYLIEKIHLLTLEGMTGTIGILGFWSLAIVPILGGGIVGLMRWRWQDFGPNISALISTVQTAGNVSPLRSTAKAIAACVSLGTGASLGPEGPSVEIGANIGVILGQALQVSQERLRLLLGAGAAAGLAAGFNAPIAGVFFALEVVLGTTFATSAVSLVLLSAVVAALMTQIFQAGQPAFLLPAYEVRSPLELPLYLGLGLCASLVAIAYNQAIQFAQRLFQGQVPGVSWMGQVPVGIRPVLGGICVGAAALQFPQILGIGYETVEAMLRDVQFSLPLLAALLVVKLVMTAISLGSGFVGGLFAPAMFLGASLGAAYGKLLPLILPIAAENIAAPPAYAMVGMAAVLAASVRAPLTAILLLFELTRDYRIILPLMAAVGLSVWIVERLKPITRTASAAQSTGMKSAKPDENVEFLSQLSVFQAMHQEFLTLSSTLPVLQAGLSLTRQQLHSALVVDETNQLVGIVTLQDINRTIARWEQYLQNQPEQEVSPSLPTLKLGDICTQDVLYAYEDEPISEAVARMAARGLRQLPVVDRENSQQILGLLEQERIALVSSLAITRESLRPYLKLLTTSEPLSLSTPKKIA